MRDILLILLISYPILVECIIPLNILLSIIDQFQLFDIVIQKNCFTLLMKMELFKIFADRGKILNLNEKRVHPNHQFIRCTDTIKTLTLNKSIKTQTVVITQIENKTDLSTMDISIGENVYFLDKTTFKIYEAYSVNSVHVTQYLGQFHELNKSTALFSPADDFIESLVDRRGNFHGIQLIGMTDLDLARNLAQHYIIIPDNFAEQSNYFPENETYDVTNIVSGIYIGLSHFNKILFRIPSKFPFDYKVLF